MKGFEKWEWLIQQFQPVFSGRRLKKVVDFFEGKVHPQRKSWLPYETLFERKKLDYRRDSASRRPLRRSRSYSDFGTVCQLLSHGISHCLLRVFQCRFIIAFDMCCLSLTKSFSETSDNIAISYIFVKTRFFREHCFVGDSISIFNHCDVIGFQTCRIR